MAQPQAPQLLYFADPMCSWCWGFSPEIKRAEDELGDKVTIRPIMGGLRPKTTEPMDDQSKAEIRNHWEHVEAASGQPFDFTFFEREAFIYNTEPACRAVVAARRLDETKALPVLRAIQKAFYAENRDVTDLDELAALGAGEGLDRETLRAELGDTDCMEETQRDFWLAQTAGVGGFPTVLALKDMERAVVTTGYAKWENFGEPLANWLAEGAAEGTPA